MSYKAILILGPNLENNCSPEGLKRLIATYKEPGYLVIGDGIKPITQKDLSVLSKITDSNTRIDIKGHGSTYNENHYLRIFSDRIPTKSFFEKIKDITKLQPLNIHLWSCFGEYSTKDIKYLPKSSVLTIHSGYQKSLGDLSNFALEQEIIKAQKLLITTSPFQSFLDNIAFSYQDTSLVTSIGRKIHKFSLNDGIESVSKNTKAYFSSKANEFIDFYNELSISNDELYTSEFSQEESDYFILGKFIDACDKNNGVLENRDLISSEDFLSKTINKNINSLSSLIIASDRGNLDLVKFLIDLGENVNHSKSNGATSILMTATKGHIETAKVLLEAGAFVDSEDFQGNSPLMYALVSKHEEVFELLLEHGANANHKNHEKRPLLMYAIKFGQTKASELLIKYGVDVNEIDHTTGFTPLITAVAASDLNLVKQLAKCGADPLYRLEMNSIEFADSFMSAKHKKISSFLQKIVDGIIKYSPEECLSYNHTTDHKITMMNGLDNTFTDGEL